MDVHRPSILHPSYYWLEKISTFYEIETQSPNLVSITTMNSSDQLYLYVTTPSQYNDNPSPL